VSGRDVGASVRQRLLNQSRAQGRPFQELLQYFAMERFLYRLSQSPPSDRFILKGALLLTAWRAPQSRPTMDIDLAGRTSNELGHIEEFVGAVCEVVAEPDGVEFNRASIEVSRIKEDADYEGVRVRFHATLAKARIPRQIDIGLTTGQRCPQRLFGPSRPKAFRAREVRRRRENRVECRHRTAQDKNLWPPGLAAATCC
jgi:Nucleotidyl transferase AbiEii toxin, Type IV TA system